MSLVVDASVFNKLFLKEEDTDIAVSFFRSALEQRATLLAPTLLRQEMCMTALHFEIDFSVPLMVLNTYIEAGLDIIEPADEIWLTAEKISRSGNKKSGFPSLQDGLYHALAIHAGGTFVTADTRHLAKTRDFGHVIALKDWASIPELQEIPPPQNV